MYHIVYKSREDQPFALKDLKSLLLRSRMRNQNASVTGMLLYHEGMFLQVLEGQEAAVRTIFQRIETDSRHVNVERVAQGTSLGNERIFGEWSMGFADATQSAKLLRGFAKLAHSQLNMLNEGDALLILKQSALAA